MKRVSKKVMIYFALGQLGWSILAGIISNLLVNFYQPDPTDVMYQHQFIVQGGIWLGLTVIGIITAVGRIFDAVTDPLIASQSDKCKHKLGKRIPFLRYSALPFALVTLLIFWCPVNEVSGFNIAWIAVTMILFYVCMTAYCTPYNALIPVLGKDPKDRMNISTFISITYILGTGIAFSAKMVWCALASATGLDIVVASRIVLGVMALIALVCMWIPAFLINEHDYDENTTTEIVNENAFKSLGKTFKNRQFRIFVLSDILYWVGITIFNTGFIYYVENLLKTDNYMLLFIIMTIVSFALYIPVNKITQKLGKKKMVCFGFFFFAFAFFITSFAGKQTVIPNEIFGPIISVLVGIPLAILGVVPQAIVADIAEADAYETKENHDGMFFAARTFAFKLGQSVAMLIFTSVAVIGNYTAVVDGTETVLNNGDGYRISLLIALFFALGGAIALLFYNEKKVQTSIEASHREIEEKAHENVSAKEDIDSNANNSEE